jgi:hypothetical protein
MSTNNFTCRVCGASAPYEFLYLGVSFRLCDSHYRLEMAKKHVVETAEKQGMFEHFKK